MNRVLCVFALLATGSMACTVSGYDPGPQQVVVPQSSGGQVTVVTQPVYVQPQPQPVYVQPQPVQTVYVQPQPQRVYITQPVNNGPLVSGSVHAGPNGGGASVGANIPGEGPVGVSLGGGPNGGGATLNLPGGSIGVGESLR